MRWVSTTVTSPASTAVTAHAAGAMTEVVTSLLTCPGWLNLACPLTIGHDRLGRGIASPSAINPDYSIRANMQ